LRDTALVIEPGRIEAQYWRDLWHYRELLAFLAWRDVLVRYKQTLLGAAWAVARPLVTILVFTLVFGRLARMPSGGVPYPLLVLAGVIPWQFFATALTDASSSLLANTSLVTKVYFPRLLAPTSAAVVALVDAAVATGLLALLMLYYGQVPSARLAALPLFALIVMAAALGSGYWLAALNVRFRDVRHLVPFLVQVGLYISPVGFASAAVPERWRLLYALNPLVGVIDGFRFCLLPGAPLHAPSVALSAALSGALLFTGILYFRRTERTFADVI
jgi:lipopolysaccharide transport system permease protein